MMLMLTRERGLCLVLGRAKWDVGEVVALHNEELRLSLALEQDKFLCYATVACGVCAIRCSWLTIQATGSFVEPTRMASFAVSNAFALT